MTSKVDQGETSHQTMQNDGVPKTIVASSTSSTAADVALEDTRKMGEEKKVVASDPVAEPPSAVQIEVSKDGVSALVILAQQDQVESEYVKSAMEASGEDASSVVSMPTVPVMAEVAVEPSRSRDIDTDALSVASAPAVVVGTDSDDVDGLDEYIRSPLGQNAIAERSPGGRYVRFMEKLGSGASKDVYRAYDTQEGIEVAWNVVNLAGVPKNERNRIVNEVRLLERLHHHNIISFHGSWVNRERQEVNFVTEILSSGTLKSFIDKVQVIRWKIAKRWAVQILKGLVYLHSQEPPVIHRDLKCENIFINGTSGDLRIGDLGLSTVHRNGKVLSVLGTPEFMAPDMYEDNSYDEKVDIYAFGMCLLEIFTKEIPYKECSNPAQIYKKVSRGDPPESLSRLKSRHAREFIELCLGTKDDSGKYIRPTAVELLTHDFLLQRPIDDDEVEVEPPLQERVIRESAVESSSPSIRSTPAAKTKKRPTPSIPISASGPNATVSDSASPRNKEARSNSLDDNESDRFDEMPDSEVNIRKVKVMMGRGQELKEDVDTPNAISKQAPAGMEVDTNQGASRHVQTGPVSGTAETLPTSSLHYLVAAAVIDNESTISPPYADDILKLVVTLPVEGQTQNVQFDFHLVEDDPVQVAKEMVTELGIPSGAVLEISETISGLARAARMKQDKYLGRLRNSQVAPEAQGMMSQHPQHQHGPSHGPPQGSNPEMQKGMMQQQQPMAQMNEYQHQGRVQQSSNHQSIPEYVSTHPMVPPHPQLGQHNGQQSMQQQGMSGGQDPQLQMHAPQMGQHPTMAPVQRQPQYQGQQSEPQGQNASYGHAPVHMNPQMQPQHGGQQGRNDYGQMQPQLIGQQGNQQSQHSEAQLQNAPYGHVPHQTMHMNSQHMGQQTLGEYSGNQVPGDSQAQSTQPAYGHPGHVNQSQNMQRRHSQDDYHPQSSDVQSQASAPSFAHSQRQHVQLQTQNIGQNNGDYQKHMGQSEGHTYGHPPQSHISIHAQHVGQQGIPETHSQTVHYGHPPQMQQRLSSGGRQVSADYQTQLSDMGHHSANTAPYMQNAGPNHVQQQMQMPVQSQDTSAPGQNRVQQQQSMHMAVQSQDSSIPGQNRVQQQPMHMPVQSQDPVPGQLRVHQQMHMSMQPQEPTPGQHHLQQQQPMHMPAQSQGGNMNQSHQMSPTPSNTPHQNQAYGNAVASQQLQQQGHQTPSNQASHQQQAMPAAGPSRVTERKEDAGGAVSVPQDQSCIPAQPQNTDPNGLPGPLNGQRSPSSASSDAQVDGDTEKPLDLDEDLDDETMMQELRKLDEDFKKNMMRAKKVFVSRMDNIQRIQYQREAQHQKTLEKHQKERAELEKRMQQEEIEQNRRIEQLQKEWDKRRDAVRQKQLAEANSEAKAHGTPPLDQASTAVFDKSNGGQSNPKNGGDDNRPEYEIC